jgi:predicted metalloenzyme YecM
VNYQELLKDWHPFSNNTVAFINQLFGEDTDYHCDHVALKVNAGAPLEILLTSLNDWGHCLSNKNINGRPIYIYRLTKPIYFRQEPIDILEILTPKQGDNAFKEGWDHIEMVYPCTDSVSAQSLLENVFLSHPNLKTIVEKDPSISLKLSSPKGDSESLANPTIAIRNERTCIKMHSHKLLDIIQSQKHFS